MYVDSVYVKHFQEVAQLISPLTTAPMAGCLSFYYQIQQGNDNVFSLYTRDVAGLYEEIWKADRPGNAAWNLAEVEFNAPYPMEVGVLVCTSCARVGALQMCHPHTELEMERLCSLTLSLSFLLCLNHALSHPQPLSCSPFLCVPFACLLYYLHFLARVIFMRKNMAKASQPTGLLGDPLLLKLALWSQRVQTRRSEPSK